MKIYTKTGDKGDTSLRWGERVGKDAARVNAYGDVDEANSFIGLALALLAPDQERHPDLAFVHGALTRVQREMFDLGADLAVPPNKDKGEQPKVRPEFVAQLEAEIDQLSGHLPPLKNFILPGGSQAAAALHVARTVARRAERQSVLLMRSEPVDPVIIQYLNRLSDALFTMARAVNAALQVDDPVVVWKG